MNLYLFFAQHYWILIVAFCLLASRFAKKCYENDHQDISYAAYISTSAVGWISLLVCSICEIIELLN